MKVIKPGSTSLYPVPAVVVSCGLEQPNLITLAWVGTVCSEPPAVSIAVRPERYSYDLLVEAGEFVVNLPKAGQVNIVDYCGSVSGRDVDKWAACGLTQAPASKIATPLIAEFPMALECRVTQRLNLGVHDLFLGEVLAVQVDEAVLNERNQLDSKLAQPLAYAGGYYYELGQQLGRHGDWRQGIK
jgi:flavin reductase (DIM6/NTAB) family NADH-FMN oxidoreductase RutF